ncbi:MAG: hypothetical protein GX636_01425 [Actinomycetales bacterium]|nr:hypothetical protein [Actinomycetales bacterium]
MIPESARHTDRMSGVVAEVGTDGVPLGLAVPEQLLDRSPSEVSRAVLRALTAAAGEARELLERQAEAEWAGEEWDGAGWDRSGDDDMVAGFVR